MERLLALSFNTKLSVFVGDTITYFSYVKRGEPVEVSFYNIDKPDQISELYSEKNIHIPLLIIHCH